MSFKSLKQNAKANFEKLANQLQKEQAGSYAGDDGDRFLKVTRDKGGNASILLRFLPGLEEEDFLSYVKYYSHGFKGPTGKWYIEDSLTSLGKPDPVGEYNSRLWNSVDSDESPQRKLVRLNKRRLHYVSNVYVMKNSVEPQYDGTVKLYKYGMKIFDKINDKMFPKFDDQEAFNPFDIYTGANFRLRVSTIKEGNNNYPNYDKSAFDNPSALSDDESLLESVYNGQQSLKSFVDPKNYKSYDELRAKFIQVMGLTEAEFEAGVLPGSGARSASRTQAAAAPWEDEVETAPVRTRAAPERQAASSKPAPTKAAKTEDDDDLAFFRDLAED